MRDTDVRRASRTPGRNGRAASVHVPEFRDGVELQEFSRAVLGVSDIARELSALCHALKNRSADSILTGHVRHMSVSLRSLLLNNKARLLDRVFDDEWLPAWRPQSEEVTAKVIIDASPPQEVDYSLKDPGERRTLKVPGYRHGFVVTTLPGIGKSDEARYAILGNCDVWKIGDTATLSAWVSHPLFEVDGLVYDVAACIKCVADKEGAHIDKVVDSDGIYTGNEATRKVGFTNDDAYILSRMVKFGPFSYPQVVVIVLSRYLVDMLKETVRRRPAEAQTILGQFTLTQERATSTQERLDLIMKCPAVDRIDGLPLRVTPERLVMRPPIGIGLASFAEEQARANALPQYGESYIGVPRCP